MTSKVDRLKRKSRRNFRSNSNPLIALLAFALALTTPIVSHATPEASATKPKKRIQLALPPTPAWSLLEQKATKLERENEINGWGYIISGGLVLSLAIPGYYLTEDVFAKAVYAISQSVALWSISHGSSLLLVDDTTLTFYHTLRSTPGLTLDNKEALSSAFFKESATMARMNRRIGAIAYSLGAALQFVNGATASNSDLRAAEYFVGSISALAAINCIFRKSDEERTAESLEAKKAHAQFDFLIGPVLGVQARW